MKYRWLRVAMIPLALLVIAFVRLIRPLVLIRFGEMCSFRVGHLAGNTECYLCQRDQENGRIIDIWTHRGVIANTQLARMFNRIMLVDPTHFVSLIMTVDRRFRGWEKHHADPAQFDRDIFNLYERTPPHLKWMDWERKIGEAGLQAMGIPRDAKWVCLIARDRAYLNALGGDSQYHDFRDSDVDDYRQAARALADRGYYVIRMGKVVAKQFNVGHTRIIDYATSQHRSDFMDVYLGAHCFFCLSNATGFDAIPSVFRRPICFVNVAPIEYLHTEFKDSMAIWKHHVKDSKRMTSREIFMSYTGQALASGVFEEMGVTLEANTPQEITDVALEMLDRLESRMPQDEMVRDPFYRETMQARFWDQFPRSMSPYNGRPLHGKIRMRIGTKFLARNEPVLANEDGITSIGERHAIRA